MSKGCKVRKPLESLLLCFLAAGRFTAGLRARGDLEACVCGVQMPSSFENYRILAIIIMTSTSMIVDTVMIVNGSIANVIVVAT